MIVAAIIGLLAAIAIPKFGNMIIKAKEAKIKGGLGSVRSAFSIYYADMEGTNFKSLGNNTLTLVLTPKYIDSIPPFKIPTVPSHVSGNMLYTTPAADFLANMGWGYASDMTGPPFYVLNVGILCSHDDSNGVIWSTY